MYLNRFTYNSLFRLAAAGAFSMLAAGVFAGPELAAPPEAPVGSLDNPPQLMGEKPAGIPYYEYFNYSAYAKRSYVPGYTPHASSLYENPRDYPWALCVLATPYYMYAGIPGWFFSSPRGYQSSVPSGSHALYYNQGKLDITSKLARGLPNGLRVVEPAIVPIGPQVKRGGIYIEGGGISQYTAASRTVSETRFQSPVAPTPMPAPEPPAALEK
jgi:hypothetical protein